MALLAFGIRTARADAQVTPARVLVVGATDPYHSPMVDKAGPLFEAVARQGGLVVELTRDPATLTDDNLSHYAVVVQLHLAPFDLSSEEQQALQRFIARGGGWVGVHAAGLTGTQFVHEGFAAWCTSGSVTTCRRARTRTSRSSSGTRWSGPRRSMDSRSKEETLCRI